MIFVSYSHSDEALKNRVVRHLQALTDSSCVSVWDDRRIATGQEWLREIETALVTARAAVLLISVDFLNSRFIKESELPKLLARLEKEGLKVFPVLARPCNWKMYDWLQKLQLWPRDGRPLSGLDEHTCEEALTTLVDEIERELKTAARPVRAHAPDAIGEEKEQLLLSEIDNELLLASATLEATSSSLIAVDLDAGGKYLQIRCAHGPGSEKIAGLRIPANKGIAGLVFTHKVPHLTNKLQGDATFAPSVARKADLPPRSMVSVPIILGNEVLGVAQFINKVSGPFVEEDTRSAQHFAERVAPLLNQLLRPAVEDRTFEGVRECSIIFTDITKYGRVANIADLPVTSKFLNEYLTMVCDVALDFGFWIDKFLGDGVMLVGNAPRQRAEYALDSVRLAAEVEKRMARLIEEWIRFGLDAPISELKSRIGIATGRVYLGSLGHPKAHWYTAVGPSVNLAWRLLEQGSRD
ncbi:MAG: TIR domain-containing protein, partial [Burkholderiaceae bacterium]